MRKIFLSVLKRTTFLVLLAQGLNLTTANAQVALETDKAAGSYGDPSISSTGDACLDNTGGIGTNQTFTAAIPGLDNVTYTWSVLGGIELVSSSGNSATVKPIIQDGRYNKGRLKVYYEGTRDSTYTTTVNDVCTPGVSEEVDVTVTIPEEGEAWVDLYQKFTYPDPIVGEFCVVANDTNAYSIRDLVSGNMEDGIGLDEYDWKYDNISDVVVENEPLYSSGDNSAQTFYFSLGAPSFGDSLKVRVGKCNVNQAYKYKIFKEQIPDADYSVTPSGCIPVSTDQVTIINEAVSGVDYEWSFSTTNFTFADGSGKTSRDGITVNIGNISGEIYLKSEPASGSIYCSNDGVVIDTIKITRSLGGVSITGNTCVTPGNTESYQYSITPNTFGKLKWDFPDGWTIVGGTDNETASTIHVMVAANADTGRIKVTALDCPSDTVEVPVRFTPGTVGTINTDNNCIPRNSTSGIAFSVDPVTNAETYSWVLPTGWSIASGAGTNNIVATPDGTHAGTVKVTANSACASSNTSELELEFAPLQPDSIIMPACITSGDEDVVTFSVTAVSGQTYEWDIPAGLGTISGSSTGASIDVATTGTPGTYTVKVRAVNDCDSSPAWYEQDVDVEGIGAVSIFVNPINGGGGQIGEFLVASTSATGVSYQWYQDGTPISGATTSTLSLLGSNSAEICVEVYNATCATWECYNTNYASSLRVGPGEFSKATSTSAATIYPNPVHNQMSISVNKGFTSGSYQVIDLQGDVVKEGEFSRSKVKVRTNNIPAGMYMVVLTLDGETSVYQISVNK